MKFTRTLERIKISNNDENFIYRKDSLKFLSNFKFLLFYLFLMTPSFFSKRSQLLVHDRHITPLILVHKDIGELESVIVSYTKTNRLIGMVFNSDWKMQSLNIFSGETHKL